MKKAISITCTVAVLFALIIFMLPMIESQPQEETIINGPVPLTQLPIEQQASIDPNSLTITDPVLVSATNYSEEDVALYNSFASNSSSLQNSFVLNTTIPKDELKAVLADAFDAPTSFVGAASMTYPGSSTMYAIQPNYMAETDACAQMQADLYDAIRTYEAENYAAVTANVYSAASAVNEYLCNTVSYEQVGYYDTSYSALVDHKAVCAGYAKTFVTLMTNAGYKAAYCVGTTSQGLHAWNAVEAEDGTVYYIDPTYNSDGDHEQFFWKEELEDHNIEETFWFLPGGED